MKKNLLTLLTIALILSSCSKKSDDKPTYSIDQPTLTLNYDKTHQFEVKQGSNDVDESKLTWSSSDETVGSINSSGLFTAKKIGKTTITGKDADGSIIAEITINPYSTLCKEPVLAFGSTMSNIKNKETRILSAEVTDGLLYSGENHKVTSVLYNFDNNSLTGVILQLLSTNAVVEESANFFAERYTFVGSDSDIYFFEDSNTTVGLGIDETLGFIAVYFKNTTGVVSKSNIQFVKKLFKQPRKSVQLHKILIK